MERADTDAQLAALAHRRRRTVLACVRGHSVVALADLADELVVEEQGTTIDAISAEVVVEVSLSLSHQHVPTVEDAGFVTYDQTRDLVTITEAGTVAHTSLGCISSTPTSLGRHPPVRAKERVESAALEPPGVVSRERFDSRSLPDHEGGHRFVLSSRVGTRSSTGPRRVGSRPPVEDGWTVPASGLGVAVLE